MDAADEGDNDQKIIRLKQTLSSQSPPTMKTKVNALFDVI